MTTFDTLSAFDAQFVYWDSDDTPMNMGNLCIFEGAPLFDESGAFRLDDVRRAIEARLHFVPRYRKRLLEVPGGFAHPVLVDDARFDITHHVRHVELDAPGDDDQLKAAFARAHEGMLDHTRPLWQLTFITGLEDGRVGMVQKIHHAPFDGTTTVDIMDLLFDPTPEHKEIDAPPWRPEPAPDPLMLMGATWGQQVGTLWKRVLGSGANGGDAPQPLGELQEAMAELGRIPKPPETSLNRPVGPRRRFDWVPTTLADAKRIRTLVPGSTVNDAMLAAIAGGLRELLASRGEDVDRLTLQVMVPVSLRTDAGADAGGNQVTGFVAPLPIDEPDATRRLERVHASTKELKEGKQALGIHLMTQTVDFAPAALMAAAGRTSIQQSSFMNLTITNVPGPRHELFLLGARMLELNPMCPIGNRLTLNIAVESYVDRLSIGLVADADANPDLDVLRAGIARALGEMLERAGE
jgi:diacylglycerol O-acyltransferase / wax synthase